MIIKIMPENDAEKRKIRAVEHKGIKEFFIFGNKKDDEGDLIDFHDWSGGYRYLIGSLQYFKELVVETMNAKKREEEEKNKNEISIRPPELKFAPPASSQPSFIKRSGPADGQIDQVITAENMGNFINTIAPQATPQNIQTEIAPKHPSVVDVERDAEDLKPVVEDNDEAGVDK